MKTLKQISYSLEKWIFKTIMILSHKWNGIVGVFVLILCNIGVAVGKNILGVVNETGETILMNSNLDLRFYGNDKNIIDSLQHYADSLQSLVNIHQVEQTRNVIIFTENMQPVLIMITILFSIMTGIGWYWKLCDRREMKKQKEQDKSNKTW